MRPHFVQLSTCCRNQPAMITLEFNEAINEIAGTCRRVKKRGEPKPYVFVVGAGISCPSVPLASEIEKHCCEEARQMGFTAPPPDDSAMGRYSHWFGKAYPNRDERRRYLQSIIEPQLISLANFRLAHLLLDNAVTNLVVTPNFDDFLSQALAILGRRKFRICDHPGTVDRIDPSVLETQIVHVHGTYWYYDQANLTGEIGAVARASEDTVFSMAQLLDSIFMKHSPIVVGYSGWNGDAITRALKRRLKGKLAYRMYWFCYSRDGANAIPNEIKEHPDVMVVLPPEPPLAREPKSAVSTPSSSQGEGPLIAREESRPQPQMESGLDSRGAVGTIEAQTVFAQLISSLEVEAPRLLSDPLSFFADQFEHSMPTESAGSEGTAYSFGSVLRRIRDAQVSEEQGRRKKTDLLILGEVQAAVARSSYAEAIQKAHTIRVDSLEKSHQRELIQSLSFAAENLSSSPEEEIRAADLIITISDSLSEPVRDDRAVAMALFSKGVTLGELGRSEAALAAYDEMVRRFGEASEPALRVLLAKAILNRGVTLGKLERSDEEIGAYDEVVRRFGEASEPALRVLLAKALLNKGVTLGKLDRSDEEIGAYDEVVQRFGEASELGPREQVARAFVYKGMTLGQLGRSDEAIGVYDEVVRRFGEAGKPRLREQVATALFNKGWTLGHLERREEAIGVYDEVVRRFGEASESGLREPVAMALVNKGVTLGQLARNKEAIGVYDEVVRRFGEASELSLQEQVAMALINKGETLGQLGSKEEALEALSEVERRFGEKAERNLAEIVSEARKLKLEITAGKKP
jgi:tetratricopeptide (TPR) repeat protein